jgi:excinuclease ABC subunit A
LPALETHLKPQSLNLEPDEEQNSDEDGEPSTCQPPSAMLTGHEHLSRAILVDQSPIGKTPRSNPVVYIGAFEDIRQLFAQTDLAIQRGLTASAFSFNSTQGQCERCRGAGFEKIEMQFLSDVYIRCPDCQGRRYRPHILEVKLPVSASRPAKAERGLASIARRTTDPVTALLSRTGAPRSPTSWSIADLLEATADEAILALSSYSQTPQGQRALQSLGLLQEVGLGYLRLGQPINTLSGGESQRLKLVSHVAEAASPATGRGARSGSRGKSLDGSFRTENPTLFLFDEPTTGLHFDDIRVLLRAFQRLVDSGHSLLVIEHNLDVIRSADWIIDLGPEAGDGGGKIVVQGRPEEVAACAASHTGRALSEAYGKVSSHG